MHNARVAPDRPAVTDLARQSAWSATELHAAIARAAVRIHRQLGEAAGQRLAYLGRNSVDLLVIQLACIRAGAIFVPLNWRLSAREIGMLIEDCDPALIIADTDFAALVPAGRTAHSLADWETAEPDLRPREPYPLPAPDAQRVVAILYSSGTTGKPKGVCVTLENGLSAAMGLARDAWIDRHSVLLLDMPMFHTAGLFGAAWAALLAGGSIIISQAFDARRTYDRLCDPALGITHYFSVPQMAQMMRDQPGFDGSRLRSLTALIIGGGPNPLAHHDAWRADGVAMVNAWGMSEIGSGSMTPLATARERTPQRGSIGQPHIAVNVAVIDPDGRELPAGEPGELAVRGPTVTPGYWRRPELTAAAFVDGWFRTGDGGYREADGELVLTDRIKDMYISGGENVYPAEIESVLSGLPGLATSAVIGVPDARWGEVGCVYTVRRTGATLTEADVLDHCAGRLARYKIPRHVRFLDKLPATGSGKPLKTTLRQYWAQQLAEQQEE